MSFRTAFEDPQQKLVNNPLWFIIIIIIIITIIIIIILILQVTGILGLLCVLWIVKEESYTDICECSA